MVNWDGTVSPCCYDKDGNYALGNALANGGSFENVWSGKAYKGLRDAVLKDRASIPICRNCSEGLNGLFYDVEVVRRQ